MPDGPPAEWPAINLAPIWTLMEEYGRAIHAAKNNKRRDWGTALSAHVCGAAGAVGVGLLTGHPIDFTIRNGWVGDGGVDGTGISVDVKTSTYWPAWIRVKDCDAIRAEFLALAYLSPAHVVTYCGVVATSDFLANCRVATLNPHAGPSKILELDDVRRLYRAIGGVR